mgnify:FL=1
MEKQKMKKYFYLFFVALFATMSFALTSCSDDDDEPNDPNNENIVGTWERTTTIDDDWWQKDYLQFKADGTSISITDTHFMGDSDVYVEYGRWTKKGNSLTVKTDTPSDEGIDIDNGTIKKLTKTELVINAGGMDLSFTRVDDSIIENYL